LRQPQFSAVPDKTQAGIGHGSVPSAFCWIKNSITECSAAGNRQKVYGGRHHYPQTRYVGHVTVDPDLKQIVHDLTSQIAAINVFHPEKHQNHPTEARKVDELWRIKADDLGYFIVND